MPRRRDTNAELDALAWAICGESYTAIGRKQGITGQGAKMRCHRAIGSLRPAGSPELTYATISSRDLVRRMDAPK